MKFAIPDRTVLRPVAWVLSSGWMSSNPDCTLVPNDRAALDALKHEAGTTALIDPVHWARSRAELRTVPPVGLVLGPGGSDVLLLSEVRLDGLERITAPPSLAGGSDEAVARALTREYFGVRAPLELADEGRVRQEEGRIVADKDALTSQPYEHAESVSKTWWLWSGLPWIRALVVSPADSTESEGEVDETLSEATRLLDQYGDTAARELARAHGGDEARWLELINALSFSYGNEERKGLSKLLASASRLRISPRLSDRELPQPSRD